MAVKRVIKGVHVVPMGMANAFLGGTWCVAAGAVQVVLPSRRASGAGCHRSAFDRWRAPERLGRAGGVRSLAASNRQSSLLMDLCSREVLTN